MPPASLFDFRDPLPMPVGAGRLVAAVVAAAPRTGLMLGLVCGRDVEATCSGVRRAALVEVAGAGAVWAPLACGLPEPGLLILAPSDAVALADLLLGGTGESVDRTPNRLEQELVLRHLVPALAPLAEALAEHGVRGLATGPVSDQPLPTGFGEVVVLPLELVLPAGGTVRVVLCLPAKSLLPAEAGPAIPVLLPATEQALSDVLVDVSLRLPATSVVASDIDELAPGDVLSLDPALGLTLVGVLPGAHTPFHVLTAALGRRGKRRAVVVLDLLGGL